MRSLWTDPAPAFHGRYAAFAEVDAHPRPVQADGPRIVVGGHGPAAHRRAVARGHGWIGGMVDPDALAGQLAGLRRAATEVERPGRLGRLEINVIAPNPVDAAAAERYASLGVDRLLLYPLPLENPDDVARFLHHHATLSP